MGQPDRSFGSDIAAGTAGTLYNIIGNGEASAIAL